MAMNAIAGSNVNHSASVALQLEFAARGLRGKRVLDCASGYGITTLQVMNHVPSEIVAVDSSEEFVRIYNEVLLGERSIEEVLADLQAEKVLGHLYERVREHLYAIRSEFRTSAFRVMGGKAHGVTASCLHLAPALIGGPVDAAVFSNAIHWPVNERRAQLERGLPPETAYREAVKEVLLPLRSVLKPGGILGICEPKNFVNLDTDPELDKHLATSTSDVHPAASQFHTAMNALLEARGIKKSPPKPTGLFRASEFYDLAASAGFQLLHLGLREHIHNSRGTDLLEAAFASAPMHLSKVNLPFEERLAIAREAREQVLQTLTDKDCIPKRGYSFIVIMQKPA
jgi:SAM-dependent methyltransferase